MVFQDVYRTLGRISDVNSIGKGIVYGETNKKGNWSQQKIKELVKKS